MAISPYFLLTCFYATSILALTIRSSFPSLWQDVPNLALPPSLTELLNNSASADSLGKIPPLCWVYHDDTNYDLTLTRASVTSKSATKANPGVSLGNWDGAVRIALIALDRGKRTVQSYVGRSHPRRTLPPRSFSSTKGHRPLW